MKIRLGDDVLTGELLAFLREQGCIAYSRTGSGEIEVIPPPVLREDEVPLIRALVARWRAGRPGLTIEIDDWLQLKND